MIGVHALIGIGEGDHHRARRRRRDGDAPRPRLRRPRPPAAARPAHRAGGRLTVTGAPLSTRPFIVVGVAAALALVVLLAPRANPNPDGLEKVAADKGIDAAAQPTTPSPTARSPTTGSSGVDNDVLGTGVAGLVGVAVTFVVGAGCRLVVRRRRARRPPPVAVAGADVGGAPPPPRCSTHRAAAPACRRSARWRRPAVRVRRRRHAARAVLGVRRLRRARRAGRADRAGAARSSSPGGCVSRCRSSCSPCSCRSSAAAHGSTCSASACPSRAVGGVEHRRQGHARGRRRRSCWRRPRRSRTCSPGSSGCACPRDDGRDHRRSWSATATWSATSCAGCASPASRAAHGQLALAGQGRRDAAGALFVRSYERGERVYLAMESRGYAGTMPVRGARGRRPRAWLRLPAVAGGGRRRGRCSRGRCSDDAAPALEVRGVGVRLPRRARGPARRRPRRRAPASGSPCSGPNGAGKTTLVLALNGILAPSTRHGDRRRPARRARRTWRDPAAGRHRVPGSRRPAVHADRPRGRRVRAGEPRAARRRAGRPRVAEALDAVGMAHVRRPLAAPPQLRRATAGRPGDGAGDATRRARARRAVVEPRPGGPA